MVKFRSHLVKLDIHKEALLVERETFKMYYEVKIRKGNQQSKLEVFSTSVAFWNSKKQ
jgi:hypothetical protein